jgi:hypothetical protein
MWSYPCNRPWRAIVLWDVEAPTFSLDNRLTDGGKFVSHMRRPLTLPPTRKIPGTHFWVNPKVIVRLEGTGDLPACSIEPQPTTLPRVPPHFYVKDRKSADTSVKLSSGLYNFIEREILIFIVTAAASSTWLSTDQKQVLVSVVVNFRVPLHARTLFIS